MEDIRNGIKVVHASDSEKKKKEQKAVRRKQSKETRIAKLEKKLLAIGYQNLDPGSLDRIHADKWLSSQRIEELESLRQQQLLKKQNEAQQLSLTDFMEMGEGA